jgi:hypothetical protein
MSKITRHIAPVVQRMGRKPVAQSEGKTAEGFWISRLSDDGEAIDRAFIDFAKREVVGESSAKRVVPRFSNPGEWVIDPYQGKHVMLLDAAYEGLVRRISEAFDVRALTDRRTVHFVGGRTARTFSAK